MPDMMYRSSKPNVDPATLPAWQSGTGCMGWFLGEMGGPNWAHVDFIIPKGNANLMAYGDAWIKQQANVDRSWLITDSREQMMEYFNSFWQMGFNFRVREYQYVRPNDGGTVDAWMISVDRAENKLLTHKFILHMVRFLHHDHYGKIITPTYMHLLSKNSDISNFNRWMLACSGDPAARGTGSSFANGLIFPVSKEREQQILAINRNEALYAAVPNDGTYSYATPTRTREHAPKEPAKVLRGTTKLENIFSKFYTQAELDAMTAKPTPPQQQEAPAK